MLENSFGCDDRSSRRYFSVHEIYGPKIMKENT
jgi:hypothetical protein